MRISTMEPDNINIFVRVIYYTWREKERRVHDYVNYSGRDTGMQAYYPFCVRNVNNLLCRLIFTAKSFETTIRRAISTIVTTTVTQTTAM